MKYLCLGYLDRQKMEARSQAETDHIMKECETVLQDLYETGRVVVDAGLDKATTVLRRSGGEVLIMDGPFAETKETLGGAFILDAPNLEEATRLAKLHPTTRMPVGEELGWRLEIHPAPYFKAFSGEVD